MVGFLVTPVAIIFALSLPKNETVRAGPEAGPNKSASIRDIFSGPFRYTALAFCAAFFCYGLASGAKVFYLPTFFQVSRNYSGETAALITGTLQVVGIAGYVLSAYVSKRFLSLSHTAALWATLGAATYVFCIWAPQSQLQDLIAFSVMAIFVNGTASIAIVFLMDRADPRMRGSIMGLCGSACVNAGFLVSPLITTRLVEAIGWQWMYTALVGSGLVLSGVFFFLAGLGKTAAAPVADIETAS